MRATVRALRKRPDDRDDGVREAVRVGRADVAVAHGREVLGDVADVDAHHREVAGHRLLDHVGRSFRDGGEQKDVRGVHHERDLFRRRRVAHDEAQFRDALPGTLHRRLREGEALDRPLRVGREHRDRAAVVAPAQPGPRDAALERCEEAPVDAVRDHDVAGAPGCRQPSRAAPRLGDRGREEARQGAEGASLDPGPDPLPVLGRDVEVVADVGHHDRVAQLQAGEEPAVPGVRVDDVVAARAGVEPDDLQRAAEVDAERR